MRRYGAWVGDPEATPENPRRCIVEVVDRGGRSLVLRQCWNTRGQGQDGLFCATHAKRLALGKVVAIPRNEG